MINIKITDSGNLRATIGPVSEKDQVLIYKFSVENPLMSEIKPVRLEFTVPSAGAYTTWNSNCTFDRGLKANWLTSTLESRLYSGAPTQEILGADGRNVLNVSILDAAVPVNIGTGIIEETAEIYCSIEFFPIPVGRFPSFETEMRIDRRSLPFYTVLRDVRNWWTREGHYIQSAVPETSKRPVNSLWYSFHQNLDVEKILHQCRLSWDLGMNSVIVDDGWETDDCGRGFAYCGDWEPSFRKVKCGMQNFVKRVHETGLKFLLWFSVPYVGKYSKAFNQFQGKITNFNGDYGCLDPRYPDVRAYLIGKYEKAVREWDLDGLKLDFIDHFALPKETDRMAPGRDTESLEEAIQLLLNGIQEQIYKIKPDFCFEFRQTYIGPIVSTYGTMLRVIDCPGDAVRNRVGILDIRLLSDTVPAHSDMIMWDTNDKVENAALQIINVLFGVPQISMLLDKLPEDHYKMLRFYLNFWNRNREVLLDGDLVVENQEANYSFASVEKDNLLIAAAYSKPFLTLNKEYSRIIFVNGTGCNQLFIEFPPEAHTYCYKIWKCTGIVVKEGLCDKGQLVSKFTVPRSGYIEFELKSEIR